MARNQTLLIILGLFIGTSILACGNHNVSGYAWSDTIGWISMSCTSGIDYGVDVNETTGAVTGYAWSENIGWIDFSGATVDLLTGDLSGWAQAVSPVGQPSEIAGGWDGLILLDGVNIYGSGYGWGGGITIGWVDFDLVTSTLSYNPAPSVTNPHMRDVSGNPSLNCFTSNPPVFLDWTFNDPGDSQSSYEVEVTGIIDTGKVVSASETYTPSGLSFNTFYNWRVRVWDSEDKVSNWANSSFTTPSRWPRPSFVWLQDPLSLDVFFNSSVNYCSSCSYNWDFGDGLGISIEADPIYTYGEEGDYDVVLSATSSEGTCNYQEIINVGGALPLPTWQEATPF